MDGTVLVCAYVKTGDGATQNKNWLLDTSLPKNSL
jgi:hypothetical protein